MDTNNGSSEVSIRDSQAGIALEDEIVIDQALDVPLAAHSEYLGHKYFASLDGLRCLAIGSVIAAHATVTARGEDHWGRQGVNLFFVISGFLITTLLLRERSRDGSISLKNFYLRRALRIFPLYYAVLALYIVIVLVVEGLQHPQGRQFFRNLPFFLTYTGNWFMDSTLGQTHFAHSWSLATEEQFYLTWPLAIWLCGRKTIIPVIFMSAVLVGALVLQPLAERHIIDLGFPGNTMLLSIATPICMGSLLAYALHFPKPFRWFYVVLGRWWSGTVFLAMTALLSVWLVRTPAQPLYVALWLAMAGMVGSVCIRDRHVLRPLMANRIVVYIGTISYGMYMMNQLCRHAVPLRLREYNVFLYFLASGGVTVLVASISYYIYERPFLRIKDRFRRVDAKPD